MKTSTSPIVFIPLKSTSSQSGYAFGVASFHPPPAPQFSPFRSPSVVPLGGKPPLYIEDAVAVPPLAASATLTAADEAVMLNVRGTSGAALKLLFPDCDAVIVQLPAPVIVAVLP